MGRFTTHDPLGVNPRGKHSVLVLRQYGDGVNLYEYVAGCPSTREDPFGLASHTRSGSKKKPGRQCAWATAWFVARATLFERDIWWHDQLGISMLSFSVTCLPKSKKCGCGYYPYGGSVRESHEKEGVMDWLLYGGIDEFTGCAKDNRREGPLIAFPFRREKCPKDKYKVKWIAVGAEGEWSPENALRSGAIKSLAVVCSQCIGNPFASEIPGSIGNLIDESFKFGSVFSGKFVVTCGGDGTLHWSFDGVDEWYKEKELFWKLDVEVK